MFRPSTSTRCARRTSPYTPGMLRQPSVPTWLPRRRRIRGLMTASGSSPMSITTTRSGVPIWGAAKPIPLDRRMLANMSATNCRIARSTRRILRLRRRRMPASASRRVTIRRERARTPRSLRTRPPRGRGLTDAEATPGPGPTRRHRRTVRAGLRKGHLGPRSSYPSETLRRERAHRRGYSWWWGGENPCPPASARGDARNQKRDPTHGEKGPGQMSGSLPLHRTIGGHLSEAHLHRMIPLPAVRQGRLRLGRLERALPVGGAHADRVLAGLRGRPGRRPELPGVHPQRLLHGGGQPGLAAVGAELDLGDPAVARERPAAKGERGAVFRLDPERAVGLDDRLLVPPLLFPVAPDVLVLERRRLDRGEPFGLLHPVAVEQQHTDRGAVLLRNRSAVHLVGQHGQRVHRHGQRDRLLVPVGGGPNDRLHLRLDPRLIQKVLHAHAVPPGGPDQVAAHLVADALKGLVALDRGGGLLELIQGERERLRHEPLHFQLRSEE